VCVCVCVCACAHVCRDCTVNMFLDEYEHCDVRTRAVIVSYQFVYLCALILCVLVAQEMSVTDILPQLHTVTYQTIFSNVLF